MRKSTKNLLYTASKPTIAFFVLLSLPWIIPAVNLITQNKIVSAIKLLLFGLVFLFVLFIFQTYFKKMLILYQKNLDKVSRNNKNYKKIKGGF